MRPRALATLAAAVLLACTGAVGGAPPDRPIDYAGTAVALSRPATPTLGVTGASPVATAALASVGGRIAVARAEAIVVIEGGAEHEVYRAVGEGRVKEPALSPDGATVVFAYLLPRPTPAAGGAEEPFVSDLMAVGVDGANPRVLVAHDRPGAVLEGPRWAPGGRGVYYSYYAPTYQDGQVVAETVQVRRRDAASGATETVVGDGSSPSASPDGHWLAYVGEDPEEGQSLRVIQTDGGGERVLVKAGDQFSSLLAPRFSPDGATIAFSGAGFLQPRAAAPNWLGRWLGPAVALAHGVPWEIWTVAAAGGQPRQLTKLAEDTPYAAWSADGRRLLVYGLGGLYVVDARSGAAQALSRWGDHGGMDWRPGP